ncbi:hypothetical protein G3I51_23805 [Streptomyces sp. SID9944]|nr:hypothetical protein [Streptomyces sp. SID9944]
MSTVTEPDASRDAALAILPLPSLDGLSEHQVRGVTCVWDGITLSELVAVDLGPRIGKRAGAPFRWFPRGCRRCTGRKAYRALFDHAPDCDECRTTASGCALGRALNRLALAGGR